MARWLGWTHPKLPPVDLSPSCRCLSRLPCSECKAWGAHCQRTSILSPYLHSEAVAHKGDQRSQMSGRYTAPSPWGRICFSSEQCLSLHCFPAKKNQGEVLEWLKRHAWKVCKRQKRFAGSNPALSAKRLQSDCKMVVREAFKTRVNRCRTWSYNDFSLYAVHRPDGLPLGSNCHQSVKFCYRNCYTNRGVAISVAVTAK